MTHDDTVTIDRLSEEQMEVLAQDLVSTKVFMTCMVPEHDYYLIPMIFLPVSLGAMDHYRPLMDQIGCLYEYFDKAGPRSINGYPIFMSYKVMHVDDLKCVLDKAREIHAFLQSRKKQ